MAFDILGLMIAGAGASFTWWMLQRWRDNRHGLRELESSLDPDASIAFSVAVHAVKSRAHPTLLPVHLLYGLLQVETFTAAVERLEGEPDAIETRVLAVLDDTKSPDLTDARAAGDMLSVAYAVAHAHDRKVTIIDLWSRLARHDCAKLLEVDPHALLFLLVHGSPPPPTELPDRTEVHVILRNDDVTTQEFVTWILREVFELSEADATERMLETHTQGKSIIGRYKLAVARDKIISVRGRARDNCFPLWIGLEDC